MCPNTYYVPSPQDLIQHPVRFLGSSYSGWGKLGTSQMQANRFIHCGRNSLDQRLSVFWSRGPFSWSLAPSMGCFPPISCSFTAASPYYPAIMQAKPPATGHQNTAEAYAQATGDMGLVPSYVSHLPQMCPNYNARG